MNCHAVCGHHTMEEASSSSSANCFTDTLVRDEAEDFGRPVFEKTRPKCSGNFKRSRNIPFLTPSKKGDKYTYCSLCFRDFSVAHGRLNDAKRHCHSSEHQRKHSEQQSCSSIATYFGESIRSHSSKVLLA